MNPPAPDPDEVRDAVQRALEELRVTTTTAVVTRASKEDVRRSIRHLAYATAIGIMASVFFTSHVFIVFINECGPAQTTISPRRASICNHVFFLDGKIMPRGELPQR